MTRDECLRRITDVLERDERVRAAWLAGSLGRGAGDELSDLDLVVVVAEPELAAFADSWVAAVSEQVPVVLHQRLNADPVIVLNQVSEEWIRFDLSVVSPEGAVTRDPATMVKLFDRDCVERTLTGQSHPLPPSGPRVASLTQEFMRVLGLLPVVLGRKELEVGASGSGLIRTMLVQLMLEDAFVPDRRGAMTLREVLREEHLQILRGLPPIDATMESIVAVHVAVARAFLPLARRLIEQTAQDWPTSLEEALRRHLDRTLDLQLSW